MKSMSKMPIERLCKLCGRDGRCYYFVNSRMLSEDSGKISCAADLLARDYTWKHEIADGGWWPRVLGYVAALSSSCDWV
jgi:hypothetical protein